jgi:NAD(P)-dependent dehydrogenase (short-subunit alcohol dehydrogenase family)
MSYVAKPQDGIAWVSSAGTGLGRALAMALAEEGWTVAVSGRSPVDLETLVAACAECPGKIAPYPGDLTKGGIVAQIVKRIESKQGPIALAILLPSEDEAMATGTLTRETLDHAHATGFVSVTNALIPLLPGMRQRGLGQIAVVSSVIGYGGLPDMRATGAAKAALINLAESMQGDLATEGVRLQVIIPGPLGKPPESAGAWMRRAYLPYDEAASRVVVGLRNSARFEIAFPRRVVWPMKVVNLLPYPLYFALTKFVRPKKPDARSRRVPRTSTARTAGPSDSD